MNWCLIENKCRENENSLPISMITEALTEFFIFLQFSNVFTILRSMGVLSHHFL